MVEFLVLVLWWLFFSCHGSTETRNYTKRSQKEGFGGVWSFRAFVAILFSPRKHGNTELHQKISKRRLWWVLELWSFCGISFLATEARKHGITPKDLKKKALVGFGALVAILFSCFVRKE
jgi:hypothetical protein